MFDDGEDLLDAVGILLAVFLVAGVAIAALAGATAIQRANEAPDTEWEFERVNDSHVGVVHAGGEPMDPKNLVVTVDGLQRQVSWNGTVRQGDSVVVEADSGALVRVFWDAGEGDRELLGRYRVD